MFECVCISTADPYACVIRCVSVYGCVLPEGDAACKQNPHHIYANQIPARLYLLTSCQDTQGALLYHYTGMGLFLLSKYVFVKLK